MIESTESSSSSKHESQSKSKITSNGKRPDQKQHQEDEEYDFDDEETDLLIQTSNQSSLPTNLSKINSSNNDEDDKEQEKLCITKRLTYLCFFVLGSSFLLPWNSILISSIYFGSRLRNTSFRSNYLNIITTIFTLCSVIFLSIATLTLINSNPKKRIIFSLSSITILFILLLISTTFKNINNINNNNDFFDFLVLITIGFSSSSAYLQSSIFGLSSSFGSTYVQAVLSGQAAIAALISLVQLLASVRTIISRSADSSLNVADDEEDDLKIRKSSFTFYLVATLFSSFALISFLILINSAFYKNTINRNNSLEKTRKAQVQESGETDDEIHQVLVSDSVSTVVKTDLNESNVPSSQTITSSFSPNDDREDQEEDEEVSLRTVESKVRILGICLFLNFFITLSVFPSLTGFIVPYDIHNTTVNLSDNRRLKPSLIRKNYRAINHCEITSTLRTSSKTEDQKHGGNVCDGVKAKIKTRSVDNKGKSYRGLMKNKIVFVQLHYLIFNLGDWFGRSIIQFRLFDPLNRSLIISSSPSSSSPSSLLPSSWLLLTANSIVMGRRKIKKKEGLIFGLTLSRVAFVVLFLGCNVEGSKKVLFNNDIVYMIILAFFSISNGYLSTVSMVSGIS
ncbi:hypothetical protein BY996DRAFT_6996216, partial [Phakopsora pachyrhizi]